MYMANSKNWIEHTLDQCCKTIIEFRHMEGAADGMIQMNSTTRQEVTFITCIYNLWTPVKQKQKSQTPVYIKLILQVKTSSTYLKVEPYHQPLLMREHLGRS